ncbi:MAG: tripartite tricarboxylate transporter TctB family protein [Beijerinckiaceae bacterium]|nr:tripartite tricarboxylate transporter TctB family protein [Beijerinckiaceae bacterium]MCZ8301671.1 tripartite tricarboxylate transporter TctB family protein [Beijerinckiaceae bacterium]
MREGQTRRPGEAVFVAFLALASLGLLVKAYGIAGFEALSSPGALPMAASAVMLVSAVIIIRQTMQAPAIKTETIREHILPPAVVAAIIAITAYAFLLEPLGFLITSFLFLAVLIRVLSGRSLFFCVWSSAACVLLIYVVFRIVFSVLMPEGIVPEREILARIGRLFSGAR